jgi:hypothetical protein
MKRIQTIADVEVLKGNINIPKDYLEIIETEFMNWFEAEGIDESLKSFQLPNHSCIYHLEDKQDTSFITNQILFMEYAEKETVKDCTYYRIGIMSDHQMIVAFFIKGTLDEQFEKYLDQRGID